MGKSGWDAIRSGPGRLGTGTWPGPSRRAIPSRRSRDRTSDGRRRPSRSWRGSRGRSPTWPSSSPGSRRDRPPPSFPQSRGKRPSRARNARPVRSHELRAADLSKHDPIPGGGCLMSLRERRSGCGAEAEAPCPDAFPNRRDQWRVSGIARCRREWSFEPGIRRRDPPPGIGSRRYDREPNTRVAAQYQFKARGHRDLPRTRKSVG